MRDRLHVFTGVLTALLVVVMASGAAAEIDLLTVCVSRAVCNSVWCNSVVDTLIVNLYDGKDVIAACSLDIKFKERPH
jgi:hypothetical protein